MKVYIAGPMTNLPQFNFPTFDAAATDLRARGYEVVSPAELDDPETREMALASPDGSMGSGSHNGETWGDFLARDVKLIADEGIEGIVTLPGWERSRGARLETFVARLCGLPVLSYSDTRGSLVPVPTSELDEAHAPDEAALAQNAILGVFDPCLNEPECIIGREEFPDDEEPSVQEAHKEHISGPLADVAPYSFTHPLTGGPGAGDHISVSVAEQRATTNRVLESLDSFVEGEERVTNEATGGEKGRKPERMELLPWDVLMRDVAPLYAAGARKYADNNWRKGYDWSLSFGAMMRHASQFWGGQEFDEETGCSHLASVVFHALALLLFAEEHTELDDRPCTAMAA